MKYDAIVIGAGLSGLSAGIRLSHFDKKVIILESHNIPGGMNSYYTRGGRSIDVGLHAMTNFCLPNTRNAPLTKLLRQLRIKYSDLQLAEQRYSEIQFPGKTIKFTNNIETLRQNISAQFPEELAGFDKLRQEITSFTATALDNKPESALNKISQFINNRKLIDMLLCPIMFYGNAMENDMDWNDFAVLWESTFESGLSRPELGMKNLLNLLEQKYLKNQGELRYNCRATNIIREDSGDLAVTLSTGETLYADKVFSSARLVETYDLCGIDRSADLGKICYGELVVYLDTPPAKLGCEQSIIFFSQEENFTYKAATEKIDLSSGVICIPNNFNYTAELPEGCVRLSFKAGYSAWENLTKEQYRQSKKQAESELIDFLQRYMPAIREHITFTDMFTPLTITRYTGHKGGSIYGSATKVRDGRLDIDGVYLIGTDQGFLGIVGALLSGISIVNSYGLK